MGFNNPEISLVHNISLLKKKKKKRKKRHFFKADVKVKGNSANLFHKSISSLEIH